MIARAIVFQNKRIMMLKMNDMPYGNIASWSNKATIIREIASYYNGFLLLLDWYWISWKSENNISADNSLHDINKLWWIIFVMVTLFLIDLIPSMTCLYFSLLLLVQQYMWNQPIWADLLVWPIYQLSSDQSVCYWEVLNLLSYKYTRRGPKIHDGHWQHGIGIGFTSKQHCTCSLVKLIWDWKGEDLQPWNKCR